MDQDDKKKQRGDALKKMQDLFDKSMYASVIANGPGESLRKAQAASSLLMSGGFAEQLRKAQEAASFIKSSNSMGFSPSLIGSVLAGAPAVHTSAVSMYLNTARYAANNTGLVGLLGNSSNLWDENGLKAISQSAKWLERQKDSALYNYLTAAGAEDVFESLNYQEDFSSDSVVLDVSTWEEVSAVEPAAENEIIDLLKNGKSLSQLSDGSRRYWLTFCFCLFFTLMNNASALITVGTWIQSMIAVAENPREVRKQLGALSGEQRALMEGQSVTTGEQVILRSSSSADSPELGRMARGVFLEVLEGSKDGWVHVLAEIDGEMVEGWVARRYVVVF